MSSAMGKKPFNRYHTLLKCYISFRELQGKSFAAWPSHWLKWKTRENMHWSLENQQEKLAHHLERWIILHLWKCDWILFRAHPLTKELLNQTAHKVIFVCGVDIFHQRFSWRYQTRKLTHLLNVGKCKNTEVAILRGNETNERWAR